MNNLVLIRELILKYELKMSSQTNEELNLTTT